MNTLATNRNVNRPNPAQWLNPRRRDWCAKLVQYLLWHGRKVILTGEAYADLEAEHGLSAYQADAAIDDLYTLGVVNISHRALTTIELINAEALP